MNSYYCNDVVLPLPNVQRVVDLSRHCLEIVTEEDAELQLVIERARPKPDVTLQAEVEKLVAERRRSWRGFELMSLTERSYADITGLEVRVNYVDKERGPLFVHEFHCMLGEARLTYVASCRLVHTAACGEWMNAMLEDITLP